MNKFIYTLLIILGLFTDVLGQKVTGKILDSSNGEPVINAIVKVIETGAMSISDQSGVFVIEAPANGTLEIKHLSYITKIVDAKDVKTIKLKPRAINLDEIVVKSSPLDDIAHSVVITDNIKKGSQPRNVADLFNDIPGFSIQKRSATAMEPSFRAFKYEEMNIKYDGVSKIVHACPNRMDPITAHVIPEEVSKIEIVKGPYTVRFGQRFGASINMVTRSNRSLDTGFHGSLETGYETNGSNFVGRAQMQYIHKKYDITLNGEYRDFGNYKDGNNTTVSSSFKTESYSIKLGYNPGKNQRLQFDYREKFGKNIMHAGLPMDSPKDDSYLISADYKIEKISEKVKSFQLKTYYSAVDHLMDNILRPSFEFMYARTPVSSNTMGGKFEIGFTPSSKILIYAGVDADIIKRDGKKYVTVKKNPVGIPFDPPIEKQFNVWHDATSQDFGIFAEGNYQLSSFVTANFGLRVDYNTSGVDDPDPGFAELYGGKIDDVTDINPGGNASVKYLKNDFQIQLAFGRGIRSASMIERYIYRFTIGSDPRDYIGNPYLKPEVNNQLDLSLTKFYNGFSFGTGLFYSYFQNYITSRVNSSFTSTSGGCGGGEIKAPKQFWNVNAYQYGFDAFFKYEIFKGLSLNSDIAYTYAQNTTFDEPLAQVAPMSGHMDLKWERKKYWLDTRMLFVAKQNRYSTSFDENETPGYSILDFRAGIKPMNGLSIGFAALNILNKAYYNHLNFSYKNSDKNQGRIFEPGRSFSAYVKYKF